MIVSKELIHFQSEYKHNKEIMGAYAAGQNDRLGKIIDVEYKRLCQGLFPANDNRKGLFLTLKSGYFIYFIHYDNAKDVMSLIHDFGVNSSQLKGKAVRLHRYWVLCLGISKVN